MASKTSRTELRRKKKTSKSGYKRKKLLKKIGTTPPLLPKI